MIRELSGKEYSEFARLWKKAFGDDEEVISRLFQGLGDNVRAYILEFNSIAAELTQFDMGSVVMPLYETENNQELTIPALISYAICTDPSERGKGYGSQITTYASGLAAEEGKASMLCPAEPGLVNFYEPLGYKSLFLVREKAVHSKKVSGIKLEHLTPRKYGEIREKYLEGTVHFRLSDGILKYIGSEGTDMYRIIVDGKEEAICAAYTEMRATPEDSGSDEGNIFTGPEKVLVMEEIILSPDGEPQDGDSLVTDKLSSAAANILDCQICQYRTPVINEAGRREPSEEVEVQAMIAFPDENSEKQFKEASAKSRFAPYFGFPLD